MREDALHVLHVLGHREWDEAMDLDPAGGDGTTGVLDGAWLG